MKEKQEIERREGEKGGRVKRRKDGREGSVGQNRDDRKCESGNK